MSSQKERSFGVEGGDALVVPGVALEVGGVSVVGFEVDVGLEPALVGFRSVVALRDGGEQSLVPRRLLITCR